MCLKDTIMVNEGYMQTVLTLCFFLLVPYTSICEKNMHAHTSLCMPTVDHNFGPNDSRPTMAGKCIQSHPR